MKRLLLLVTLCIIATSALLAQTYSEKVEIYNTHQYVKKVGDPYNPIVAGVASYFIPGLGQMICDESSRGLSFLGGYVGCAGLFMYGYVELAKSMMETVVGNNTDFTHVRGGGKMALGAVGMLGIGIWSIVDAVQVAKVNNMCFQDNFKKTGSIDLEIAPYSESISFCNQRTVPIGLTLRASF
jgi:hypothetical protein